MDFISDSLTSGRRFRILNIIDDYNRQALCARPEFSMPSICVATNLKQAIEVYGKPSQNGYLERFNKTFRVDVLDVYLFRNLEKVRSQTETFRQDYNQNHPYKSLERKSPN